jgi:hypothetical protein
MLSIATPTTGLLAAAALALGACGGDDDRLTRAQYEAEVRPAVQRIAAGFGAVFQAIGRAEETDRVPAAALRRLAGVAAVERREADRLAALEPPEDLEGPAGRLTADAVEQGATATPLRELAEHGVVDPPGHDE